MRILFAGTPDFAATALAALLASDHQLLAVLTQPDRPAGRGKKLTASPVKQLALEVGLPVLQPQSLKDPAIQQQLAAFNADVMVVVAYGLIIPQAVLDLPRFGCLNIHASLLPRWRGAAPIQRAIEAGDAITGVTIMQMEAGLDTGPMLHVVTTPITADDTGGSLHDRLAQLGAGALLATLHRLPMAGTPQDDAASCYATKLSKPEARIDWRLPATRIHNLIRAFNPWPVAFTELAGDTVRVWKSRLAQGKSGPAGEILAANAEGLLVACDEGALWLEEIQLPGGKVQPVAALLNGQPDRFANGVRFI
jgi:methionyl-tRNA formyltransferase